MNNIKNYNLEDLKQEMISIGENHIEQNKYLSGYT